jgi:hypothetical protein
MKRFVGMMWPSVNALACSNSSAVMAVVLKAVVIRGMVCPVIVDLVIVRHLVLVVC